MVRELTPQEIGEVAGGDGSVVMEALPAATAAEIAKTCSMLHQGGSLVGVALGGLIGAIFLGPLGLFIGMPLGGGIGIGSAAAAGC